MPFSFSCHPFPSTWPGKSYIESNQGGIVALLWKKPSLSSLPRSAFPSHLLYCRCFGHLPDSSLFSYHLLCWTGLSSQHDQFRLSCKSKYISSKYFPFLHFQNELNQQKNPLSPELLVASTTARDQQSGKRCTKRCLKMGNIHIDQFNRHFSFVLWDDPAFFNFYFTRQATRVRYFCSKFLRNNNLNYSTVSTSLFRKSRKVFSAVELARSEIEESCRNDTETIFLTSCPWDKE